MGGFLDKPITQKSIERGSGNGMRYCVSSMQGWRIAMEDAHKASCELPKPFEDWGYFAVFDGHAGRRISDHCARHLLSTILETKQFAKGQYVAGMRAGFLQLDEDMRQIAPDKPSGSTAVCVFVAPQYYYFANIGDSRAVISRRGRAVFSTVDHKPTLPEERERIQKAGGSVMIQRVNGTLAVSRALGDFDFKADATRGICEQLISPEPDVTLRERLDTDQFLVVACDGIWDVMTSDEVCAYIQSRLCISDNLTEILNSLLDVCLRKGSRDNMSILLVLLPGAPKVCPRSVKAEMKLDRAIVELARDVIVQHEIIDFEQLVRVFNGLKADLPHLPPGGGLFCKYDILQRIFRESFPDKPQEFFEHYPF